MEHLFWHEHLPPDDEPGRGVGDFQGDRPDGAQIFGDVLPYPSVPTGGPPHEKAVLILQGHRQPVHFGLHHILHLGDGSLYPLVKGFQLLKVKYILEGLQGHPMGHLGEGFQGLAPHPLGR